MSDRVEVAHSGKKRDTVPTRPNRRREVWPAVVRMAVLCSFLQILPAAAVEMKAGASPRADLEVKASFVVNFMRLVNWSELPGEKNRTELGICALSKSEFFLAVRDAAADKKVGTRTLAARIDPNAEPSRCRVLIVDAAEYAAARLLLRGFRESPVLTVGNGPGFLDIGGMFELDLQDRKVQFDVSLSAIRKSGLEVSARLLQLSRTFRKGENGGS